MGAAAYGARDGLLLAGDVGGTKTLLGLFDRAGGPCAPIEIRSYESTTLQTLDEAIEQFLDATRARVHSASFGVAGPVIEERAELTNLAWGVDAGSIGTRFGFGVVTLMNDLVATASALPVLRAEDLVTLQPGVPEAGGTKAIIAPGTGLGQAFLTWDGDRYVAHPSEGGHADFAPRDALQVGLLRYVGERFGHVSYERVCSGPGIPVIYQFLRDSGVAPEPAELGAALESAPDPTPVIVEDALSASPSELSRETLRIFVSVLAAEAGNLGLTVMATSGIYLGGGIPPRVLPLLQEPGVVEAFRGKGRMSEILGRMPLHVVMRPDAALVGAAARGLALMRRP